MLHAMDWSFAGMHFFWWMVWIVVIGTAFVMMTPVLKNGAQGRARALDILRRRYAAGQISNEEYEYRKELLERFTPQSAPVRHAH